MKKRKAIYFRIENDNETIIGKVFSINQNKEYRKIKDQIKLVKERYFSGYVGPLNIQTGNPIEFSGIFRNFQENKINIWITTHFKK